jgi:hypothetical protein
MTLLWLARSACTTTDKNMIAMKQVALDEHHPHDLAL